ncbi:hypothetical protein [Corynebacterium sp. A21]|uniref:hypothetical protein n=1 Tax=Corynebacterium sp. A21 TaxID=3457318 RepID=UPI003FD0BBDB
MRRSLIALATALTLTFGALPAATAAEGLGSSQQLEQQLEELPAELKIGSSAAEDLSEGDNTQDETVNGSLDLGKDWLIGAALITILGGLMNLLAGVLS